MDTVRVRVNPSLIPTNAAVTVGTVTTLTAGSNATVANVGTPQNPVLNFGIPRGDPTDVTAGIGINVDASNPVAPIVSIADGDHTDVVVSGGGATWTIPTSVLSTFWRTITSAASAAASWLLLQVLGHLTTRTLIKALTPSVGMAVFLSESGRQGEFVWRADDYSVQIAADTAEVIYFKANSVASSAGAWVRTDHKIVDLRMFGAVGDGVILKAACSIANGTAALTVAGASFKASDVGKVLEVDGAGAAGVRLKTTIAGYTSATQVTLGANASTTLSASTQQVVYGTDDATALQAAITISGALGLLVRVPALTFLTSAGLDWKDAAKWQGAGAWFKSRSGYLNSESMPSIIVRIGTGGANSYGVNLSAKPVGTVGTDFTAPATDDLVGVIFRDIHVDANNLAEIAVNMYRCGNNSGGITRVTVERAKKAGFIMNGLFSFRGGYFGAYTCEDRGAIIGYDYFSFGSNEAYIYDSQMAFDVASNGTAITYVAGSGTDQNGCGLLMQNVGRGSVIELSPQSNVGRAWVHYGRGTTATDGPVDVIPHYLEGNGDGARIEFDLYTDGLTIRDGFVHPGNGGSLAPQTFKLVAYNAGGAVTTDEGPAAVASYPRFRNLWGTQSIGGTGFAIDSNSVKFVVDHCEPSIGFTTRSPTSADDPQTTERVPASSVAVTATGTPQDTLASPLNLGPGTWEVTGSIGYLPAASTSITRVQGSISTTSATLDLTTLGAMVSLSLAAVVPGNTNQAFRFPIGPVRITVAPGATQNVYLVAQASFSVSTLNVFGGLKAKRVAAGA